MAITGVIIAVKEWSEALSARMQEDYGSLVRVEQIENLDASGICAKYNKGIDKVLGSKESLLRSSLLEKAAISNDWVVFTHDDAIIKSTNIYKAIDDAHVNGADIVCVAGTTKIPPLDPGYWWKGLTEKRFRGSGAVIHRTPGTKDTFHIESYGPYPQQVAAFDGLWFAVKTSLLIKNNELRFDESYPGYHYYDVDFAATARCLGYKIWTADIQILHDKWGRGMEDPAFAEHQKIFMDKWSKKKHLYYLGAPDQVKNKFIDKTKAF